MEVIDRGFGHPSYVPLERLSYGTISSLVHSPVKMNEDSPHLVLFQNGALDLRTYTLQPQRYCSPLRTNQTAILFSFIIMPAVK